MDITVTTTDDTATLTITHVSDYLNNNPSTDSIAVITATIGTFIASVMTAINQVDYAIATETAEPPLYQAWRNSESRAKNITIHALNCDCSHALGWYPLTHANGFPAQILAYDHYTHFYPDHVIDIADCCDR